MKFCNERKFSAYGTVRERSNFDEVAAIYFFGNQWLVELKSITYQRDCGQTQRACTHLAVPYLPQRVRHCPVIAYHNENRVSEL